MGLFLYFFYLWGAFWAADVDSKAFFWRDEHFFSCFFKLETDNFLHSSIFRVGLLLAPPLQRQWDGFILNVFIRAAATNNTGYYVSLFIHSVCNWEIKADRSGARLPSLEISHLMADSTAHRVLVCVTHFVSRSAVSCEQGLTGWVQAGGWLMPFCRRRQRGVALFRRPDTSSETSASFSHLETCSCLRLCRKEQGGGLKLKYKKTSQN